MGIHQSPVDFPSQRPVTRSFDIFFDVGLNKRLSKQSDAGDLRRHGAHCDVTIMLFTKQMLTIYAFTQQMGKKQSDNRSPLDLVRTPRMRKYSLVLFYSW